MTGLDHALPWILVFHVTLSSSLHSRGSPLASETPCPLGPRNRGQASPARTAGEISIPMIRARTGERALMRKRIAAAMVSPLPHRRGPRERFWSVGKGESVKASLGLLRKELQVGEVEQHLPVGQALLVAAFAEDDADLVGRAEELVDLPGGKEALLRALRVG